MKKTIMLICVALILCAAVCITAVHFTGKNDVPETSGTENVTTDSDTTAEDTTANDIEANVSQTRGYNLTLVEDLSDGPQSLADYEFKREDAVPTRTVTLLGKTVTVNYVISTQDTGRELKDTYEDEFGNEYNFSEDGTFLSYSDMVEFKSFSAASYIDKGIAPDITEDEAIALAEKIGKEVFGDTFEKVKFESVKYDGGIYDVYFYQRLGADGSIRGLRYFASILADGRIFGYGMPSVADLRDLDESKYELVTRDAIMRELAENEIEIFGTAREDFTVKNPIPVSKINGKYVLYVVSKTRSDGKDVYYEVTDVTEE